MPPPRPRQITRQIPTATPTVKKPKKVNIRVSSPKRTVPLSPPKIYKSKQNSSLNSKSKLTPLPKNKVKPEIEKINLSVSKPSKIKIAAKFQRK